MGQKHSKESGCALLSLQCSSCPPPPLTAPDPRMPPENPPRMPPQPPRMPPHPKRPRPPPPPEQQQSKLSRPQSHFRVSLQRLSTQTPKLARRSALLSRQQLQAR